MKTLFAEAVNRELQSILLLHVSPTSLILVTVYDNKSPYVLKSLVLLSVNIKLATSKIH